MIDAVLQQV